MPGIQKTNQGSHAVLLLLPYDRVLQDMVAFVNSSRTAVVRLFQLCHAVQVWAHGLQTCTSQVITDEKTNSTAVVLFREEKDIIETNPSFSSIVQSLYKTEKKL